MRPSTLTRAALRTATMPARLAPLARPTRMYSIKASAASTAQLKPIDPKKLTITKTKTPKALTKPEDLVFGSEFTGAPLFLYMARNLSNHQSRPHVHH